MVCPETIQRKNREIGGFAGGEFTLLAENAGRASGEKFDHAHERDAVRVHQLLESEANGSFESENAERRFVELYIFDRRFVWGVVGGVGVNGAVGEDGWEGFATFPSGGGGF